VPGETLVSFCTRQQPPVVPFATQPPCAFLRVYLLPVVVFLSPGSVIFFLKSEPELLFFPTLFSCRASDTLPLFYIISVAIIWLTKQVYVLLRAPPHFAAVRRQS